MIIDRDRDKQNTDYDSAYCHTDGDTEGDIQHLLFQLAEKGGF